MLLLLMLLLGAVALAVAVAFAFAVAVAVTDTFRMGGDHESYKDLIPPFLLESIIPEKAVFSPLSFIFWRGIIWTPEMWGKGVPEVIQSL